MQTTISTDTDVLASILAAEPPRCQSVEDHNCSVVATHRVLCTGGCNTDRVICKNRAAVVRARILLHSHKCMWCWAAGDYSCTGHTWRMMPV